MLSKFHCNPIFSLITLLILSNCKVENLQVTPTVITKPASELTLTTATLNGEVISEGGKATNDRGFVYSKTENVPTFSNQKIPMAYGVGPFKTTLTNLELNTIYYYRAYATNPVGTQFGNVEKFSTLDAKLPSVSIGNISKLTDNSLTVDYSISTDGGSLITETGIIAGTNSNPTLETASIKISNSTFKSPIVVDKLVENTKYFVRAYAKNIKGVSYSDELAVQTRTKLNEILKNGILAYYGFNNNTLDQSGNNNHLKATDILYSPDRNNTNSQSAITFNGKTTYLEGPRLDGLSNQFSIALWVKNTRNTFPSYRCLITTQNSTKQGFLLQDNENLKYNLTFANLNGVGYTDVWSKSTILRNEWELVICTYDGNIARIFKNGQLDIAAIIGLKALNSTANLMIGSRYLNEYFDGTLDDIGIWNRVLTSEEINYLASNSLQF